jgi:hypothetical protein
MTLEIRYKWQNVRLDTLFFHLKRTLVSLLFVLFVLTQPKRRLLRLLLQR